MVKFLQKNHGLSRLEQMQQYTVYQVCLISEPECIPLKNYHFIRSRGDRLCLYAKVQISSEGVSFKTKR